MVWRYIRWAVGVVRLSVSVLVLEVSVAVETAVATSLFLILKPLRRVVVVGPEVRTVWFLSPTLAVCWVVGIRPREWRPREVGWFVVDGVYVLFLPFRLTQRATIIIVRVLPAEGARFNLYCLGGRLMLVHLLVHSKLQGF